MDSSSVHTNLSSALATIPLYAKIPGITVKFLQLIENNYTVVKNDGLTGSSNRSNSS